MICRSRHNSDQSAARRFGVRAAGLIALLSCAVSPAVAQEATPDALVQPQTGLPAFSQGAALSLPDIPVLTIEPDQLYARSLFGVRLTSELEARGIRLAAENRRIEAELADEESELTARRAELAPIEFRQLADDFDARVQRVRAEQDEKARFLAQSSDAAQRAFLQAIAPILETLMIEKGASVILDRRAVFLSADASDVTEAAIVRIDSALGDGLVVAPPTGDPASVTGGESQTPDDQGAARAD